MNYKYTKIIRGDNENEDKFWKRYEKKLNELDYVSVDMHGDTFTIKHK